MYWNDIRVNKLYDEWKHFDQELEVLIMIEAYIFAKLRKVLIINMALTMIELYTS